MKERVLLIGDVVASRRAVDRGRLHERLTRALEKVNQAWGSDLRLTVGDEYQGTVPSVGAATRIALDLRLDLLPEHDVRHGIAVGATEVLDTATRIEDGPGWWAARSAIETAARDADRPGTRSARTAIARATGAEASSDLIEAIGAALLARDQLIAGLDDRALSVLRALLEGRSQRRIAEELGVSPSAISQRVRHDGLGVIVAVTAGLERLGGSQGG